MNCVTARLIWQRERHCPGFLSRRSSRPYNSRTARQMRDGRHRDAEGRLSRDRRVWRPDAGGSAATGTVTKATKPKTRHVPTMGRTASRDHRCAPRE